MYQSLRLQPVGCEVQVGEQDLPPAQQSDLRRLRLLHLDDHVRRCKHLRRRTGDRGARRAVGFIVRPDARAGIVLDDDLMPMLNQFPHPAGVSPTRYSWALISFGTPIFTCMLPRG